MGNLGNLLTRGSDKSESSQQVPGTTNPEPTTSNEAASQEAARDRDNDSDRSLTSNADDTVDEEESGDRNPVLIATSAPIQRFKIGRFQFERAVLNLYSQEDADAFRKLLKGLPPVDRNQIKIIDKDAAEAMVRPIEPGATKQFDSSVGRQRETLATGDKVIGQDPLDPNVGGQGEKFAKDAQMDNNAPVAGVEGKNVVNQVNQGDVQSDEQKNQQAAANEATGQ